MTATYPDLRDRTVVVTGGSRGIGAQVARAFAEQGARVSVVGRDQAALDAVAAGIGGTPYVADVTDFAAISAVAERTGPVDVLCAFAGGQGRPEPAAAMSPERWREIIDSDLNSAFLTIRAFLPAMIDRGRGSIITMSSTSGRQPSKANVAYGAANAGLVMLTRHLATEIGPAGVRVNCIAPSSILTERVAQMMPPAMQEQVAQGHPLQRLGTPSDVADAALFLASDSASWLTGITIDLSGGRITA